MPEGDTLFRTAAGLRPFLVGRTVTAATARQPGPQVERLVGSTVSGVEAQGKNLLLRFANGLEVRTHLGMHGSWHRYRPGERWRRPRARARLIIEVPGSIAVCFDAPTVELFEQRAESLHGALSGLGPDLLRDPLNLEEVIRRLRDPSRASMAISEALLDQRALAGIGNVYKSEVLFIERVSPFTPVASVDDPTLRRLVGTATRLLRANAFRPTRGVERITTEGSRSADGPLWVYRRSGRPCRRCGTTIRSVTQGVSLPRLTWWCPRCQPEVEGASAVRA
ncbi:MAG TPA: DNA-formamidopyrimidine glycosylase family protein [Candidatus Limnocylindrales bacterium]